MMQMDVSHYEILNHIGSGGYNTTYRAQNKLNNEYVILKRVFIDLLDSGINSNTICEINLLKQLNNNEYIIKLNDVILNDNSLYLIFEFIGYNLKQHLNKYKNILTIKQIKSYLKQILFGVSYCHSLRIIHSDLKPENILINEKSQQIKITNFGLSNFKKHTVMTHKIPSLCYQSPEILLASNNFYSISMDIWSIGCIFGEMLNKSQPLFAGDSEICQLMHIFKICGTPNDKNWPNIYNQCKYFQSSFPKWKPKEINQICPRHDFDENGHHLLKQMLTLNPQNRITAKQALRHKWFTYE
eukprot:335240_1